MREQSRDFDELANMMVTDMILDQVRKLAELHKEGILTDEEFAAKKQDLLSRL